MALAVVANAGAALSCNLTLLTAMTAGRLDKGWARRALLVIEAILYAGVAIAVVMAGLAVANSFGWRLARRDLRVGLVGALGLVIGVSLGGSLTYAEFAAVGRRNAFRMALHQSLWLGKYGVQRWVGRQ